MAAGGRSILCGAAVAGVCVLGPGAPLAVRGQTPGTPGPGEQPTFRAGVRLATVDAVVTDDRGGHVTDLTAADFEVVERGQRQMVRQLTYVRTVMPAPVVASGRPTLPSSERTGRVLAVVVDDLGLSFPSIVRTRTMLTRFLETQVAPDDLVAILRTAGGAGTLQQFTTDRRLLTAAIARVRWGLRGPPLNAESEPRSRDDRDRELSDRLDRDLLVEGALGALDYAVRGVESLPGRKAVVFVSEGAGVAIRGGSSRIPTAMGRVIDRANRAGVVLYAIDPSGLGNPAFSGADGVAQRRTPPGGIDPYTGAPANIANQQARQWEVLDRQGSLQYLSERTGGFAVVSANDLSGGLARIVDDTRGYYLIGFDTALKPGVLPNPDDVRIKVQRRGLQVRARHGRFGPADPSTGPLPRPGDPLAAAAVAPFSTGAIDVRLTALFGHDADGSHVRAIVDVDPSGLTLAESGGQTHGQLTLLVLAFDDEGNVVAQAREPTPVSLDAAAYERARTLGVRYSVRLPLTRAGGYQIRAAVQDDRSARIGTSAQFVEVPRIGPGRLALSGVVMSDAAAAGRPLATTFAPGSVIEYTCTLFDGRKDRAAGLSTSATVLMDGKPIYTSAPAPIAGAAADAPAVAPIPFRGRLTLGRDQPPGAYTLVVSVGPPSEPARRAATQWVDFEVR